MNEEINRIVVSKEEMIQQAKEVVDAGGEFSLIVTGTSMQPFLCHNRDSVCLVKCDLSDIHRGDILLYERADGSPVLHRVYSADNDGTLTMIGDNQWMPELGVERRQVIARVSRCVRNGKEVICGKSQADRLMRLWLVRMKAPGLFRLVRRILEI